VSPTAQERKPRQTPQWRRTQPKQHKKPRSGGKSNLPERSPASAASPKASGTPAPYHAAVEPKWVFQQALTGTERAPESRSTGACNPLHNPQAGHTPPTDKEPEPMKVTTRTLRSILYRRRLADSLLALELRVVEEIREREEARIALPGYVLTERNGALDITEVPTIDPQQLRLKLDT